MTWDDDISSGIAALAQNDFPMAEADFYRAMEKARTNFDHVDTRIPQTMSFLAQVLFRQGQFDKAEPLLRQALKIDSGLPESNALSRAMDLYALACIDKVRGRVDQAGHNFDQALPLFQATLPETEVSRLMAGFQQFLQQAQANVSPPDIGLQQLFHVVKEQVRPQQQDLQESAPTEAQAPAPDRPQPTPQDFDQWTSDIGAAMEEIDSGQLPRIIAGYKKADAIVRWCYEKFEPPHPCIAETWNVLALAAAYLGLTDRSEQLYFLAIPMMEAMLGPANKHVARFKLNLATLYREFDRYHHANFFFKQAFEVLQNEPEADPEWLASIEQGFIAMNARLEAYNRAYELIEQARDMQACNKIPEAAANVQEAHNTLAGHFDINSPCFAAVFSEQANIMQCLGNEADARDLKAAADHIRQAGMQRRVHLKMNADQLPPMPVPPWIVGVQDQSRTAGGAGAKEGG